MTGVGDGLVVVDKPAGWTSHDVVGRCRRLFGTRRVGHAGTLDPMATGVLLVGVNKATKLLTFLVGCEKTYRATIRLGQTTLTEDAESEVVEQVDATGVTGAAFDAALQRFLGPIDQVPSAVSAIRIDGKRSYARVRAGEDVALEARPVRIGRLDRVSDLRPDGAPGTVDVDIEAEVSSGTYVRALARDIGNELGVGAHLTALRRLAVGPFSLNDAATLEHVADDPAATLLPMGEAAGRAMPVRAITDQEAVDLRHGKRLGAQGPSQAQAEADTNGESPDVTAAVDPQGELVAILTQVGEEARSRVVFPAD